MSDTLPSNVGGKNICRAMWRHIEIRIKSLMITKLKTFITAVVFILLMLTEQGNSEFYSICFTKELASILRTQIAQIITSSPALSKHFFVSKSDMGKIKCLLNNSWYEPRVAEANKNNGIRPSVFCADEVGAFKDRSNINAMQSGQKNVLNPMRISTTTAYAIKVDK